MRQRTVRALPIVLALSSLCPMLHAQSSDTLYHLHGTVVNALTGKPIARALVTSGDRRIATLSGPEGHFAVDVRVPAPIGQPANAPVSDSLRSNNLYLTVQKPGYLSDNQINNLPLNDTLSATEVILKLNPTATIEGHVSVAGTDAPPNVQMLLLVQRVRSDGHLAWTQAAFKIANSRGEYRFSNLAPGTYTVMTSDWSGGQYTAAEDKSTSQRYPPVYFGDLPGLNSAIKIHLHYGENAQAELHLHPATYYPIRIPVTGATNVNIRLLDDNTFAGYRLIYNLREGGVTGSLPSGQYTLLLSGFGEKQMYALVPIHVAGAPITTASVTLAPGATIRVSVHTQFTAQSSQTEGQATAQSSGIQVRSGRAGSTVTSTAQATQNAVPLAISLEPELFGGQRANSTRSDNPDELVLNNLPPGRYHVGPQPFHGYVASITYGGVDLMQQPLVVGSSGMGEPVQVTLRDDSATVSGKLSAAVGTSQQACNIVFIPRDASARYTETWGPINGIYTAGNVAPGNYQVLAMHRLNASLPYLDPEAMRRFEGKGATIHITPGEHVQLDLTLLPDADAEVE